MVLAGRGSQFLQQYLKESGTSFVEYKLPTGRVLIDIFDPDARDRLLGANGRPGYLNDKVSNKDWIKAVIEAARDDSSDIEIDAKNNNATRTTLSQAEWDAIRKYNWFRYLGLGAFLLSPRKRPGVVDNPLRIQQQQHPAMRACSPEEARRSEERYRQQQKLREDERRRLEFLGRTTNQVFPGAPGAYYGLVLGAAQTQQGQAVLQILGGLAEIAIGVFSGTWGLLGPLGADQIQAGVRTLATGEKAYTVTNNVIHNSLIRAGVDRGVAEAFADIGEFSIHFAAGYKGVNALAGKGNAPQAQGRPIVPQGGGNPFAPQGGATRPPTPFVVGNPNEVITALPGRGPNAMTTLGRLNELATGGGPTTPVFTRLSQAPNPGRTLSVSVGSADLANAVPGPSAVRLFRGEVPTALINELERAGLLTRSRTLMGGVQGVELEIRPPGTLWIEPFLQEVR